MKEHKFLSDIGYIVLRQEKDEIVEILFGDKPVLKDEDSSLFKQTEKEITEYLNGKRKTFDFKYEINGTEFDLNILKAMKDIPYGKTLSYSELAKKAGYAGAARACGSVCRKNKLPLIFPCHRVIKNNGEIGNFSGGISVKKHLLEMEKDYKTS